MVPTVTATGSGDTRARADEHPGSVPGPDTRLVTGYLAPVLVAASAAVLVPLLRR
jgi:hypothetical protein